LVTYLLVGYLRAPEKIELQATRHLSVERTSPNQDVDVTVTVTNRGSSLEEILFEDLLPQGLTVRSGFHRHLLRFKKGESYTFAYTVSGPRGGYVFEGLTARVNDHLAVSRSKVAWRRRDAATSAGGACPSSRSDRAARVYAGSIRGLAAAGRISSACAVSSAR
jgi:uncharacterized repeat protein (TIGR01451 family)